MSVTTRKGPFAKLTPTKLHAGEWATVTSGDPGAADGKTEYMCFSPGIVKRMATHEDMVEQFNKMTDGVITEITKDVEGAITKVNAAAEYANSKGSLAAEKASTAEVAANRANDISDDLQKKLSSGYFKGLQGEQGKKGDRGDSGVVVSTSGLFALSGDADGNLYAEYVDNDNPPKFEVDSAGIIYYIIA